MTCQRPASSKMGFSSEILVDDHLRSKRKRDVAADGSGSGRCSKNCGSCGCWSGNGQGLRMCWLVVAVVSLALPGCVSTASDACSRALQRDDYWRDVTIQRNPEQTKCDKGFFDPSKWYTFRINGNPATIPTQCIKNNMCGAKIAMRVELADETLLQTPGQNVTATLCGSYDVLGKYDCCVLRSEVVIVRCDDGSLVYNFPKEFDRCPVVVCLQDRNTEVPSSVVAAMGQPYTVVTWAEPETTTAADLETSTITTTLDQSNLETSTITSTLNQSEPSLPDVSQTSVEPTQGLTETSSEAKTDLKDEQISTTVEALSSNSTAADVTPLQDLVVSSSQPSAATNEDQTSKQLTIEILDITSDLSDNDTATVGSFPSSEATVLRQSDQSPLDSRDDSSSSFGSSTLLTTDTETTTIDTANMVTTLIDTAPTETTVTLRSDSDIINTDALISSSSISSSELVHSTETTEDTIITESSTAGLEKASTKIDEETGETTSSGILSTETGTRATSSIPSQNMTTNDQNSVANIETGNNFTESGSTISTISITNQTFESYSSPPHQSTSVSSKEATESRSSSSRSRHHKTTEEVTKPTLSLIPETSSSPLVINNVPVQKNIHPPDVTVNETVRLVFRGNISIFESQVLSLLGNFLESVKGKLKQAKGLEWTFCLANISRVQNFLDQKSYIDFRAITMGDSSDGILKVFKDYELREYLYKNNPNLNLIAECRVSAECQKDSNQPVASASSSMFAKNTPAFVTVIVLCSVCLLVLVVAIFYSRLSKRGSWKNSEAQSAASREHRHNPGWNASPYTDQEIMKEEMVDDASCAGSAKDGDTNLAGTWVIPLDAETGSGPRLLTVATEDTRF